MEAAVEAEFREIDEHGSWNVIFQVLCPSVRLSSTDYVDLNTRPALRLYLSPLQLSAPVSCCKHLFLKAPIYVCILYAIPRPLLPVTSNPERAG